MSDNGTVIDATGGWAPKLEELSGHLLETSPIRPAFVELSDADGSIWVNPNYVAAIQQHPAGDHTFVWMANSHTMLTPGALLIPAKAVDVVARLTGEP